MGARYGARNFGKIRVVVGKIEASSPNIYQRRVLYQNINPEGLNIPVAEVCTDNYSYVLRTNQICK